MRVLPWCLLASVVVSNAADYGFDCSYPVQHLDLQCGDLLGDRMSIYEQYMQGCREKSGDSAHLCDSFEQNRLVRNLRQPQSMVNYTSTGYLKTKAPKVVMDLLNSFYQANKDKKRLEEYTPGLIFHVQNYVIPLGDTTLEGGGAQIMRTVASAIQKVVEEWTGMEQEHKSIYGIRIYREGALLEPHVDRLPYVSSAIVNVAQDVDEPWPLEVYGRDGQAINVTMEPGEMILYESASLMHGRPFALKGKYFANVFCHFEPTGRTIHHAKTTSWNEQPDQDDELPPYLLKDSPEIPVWRMENPTGWKHQHKPPKERPQSNVAAATGDLHKLAALGREDWYVFHAKDQHGWQPLHEACRAGLQTVVKFLVESGVDFNSRTHHGVGYTPLRIAKDNLPSDHPVIQYLANLGADNLSYGEEL